MDTAANSESTRSAPDFGDGQIGAILQRIWNRVCSSSWPNSIANRRLACSGSPNEEASRVSRALFGARERVALPSSRTLARFSLSSRSSSRRGPRRHSPCSVRRLHLPASAAASALWPRLDLDTIEAASRSLELLGARSHPRLIIIIITLAVATRSSLRSRCVSIR